jgi:TrmH family RNA methyltransferase
MANSLVITSNQNPKVKYVRSLQVSGSLRRENKVFVIEGVRLVEEADKANWEAELIFYTTDLSQRGMDLLEGFAERGAQVFQISENVMQAVSDTQNPQGILAVMPSRELAVPEKFDFVLIPDAVRDPGNMGTLLRTAWAAGVESIFIPPNTVDVYAPKVVRAAMGAHFWLPLRVLSWQEIKTLFEHSQVKIYLAEVEGGIEYTHANFNGPSVIVIGGEASGAGSAVQELAVQTIHIPMPGVADSLNAAIAAAIILFEVVRQRAQHQ